MKENQTITVEQTTPTAAYGYQAMTLDAFASLGTDKIAYVKPVVIDSAPGFSIHGADGRPLGAVGGTDRELVYAIVRQNELEPVAVH